MVWSIVCPQAANSHLSHTFPVVPFILVYLQQTYKEYWGCLLCLLWAVKVSFRAIFYLFLLVPLSFHDDFLVSGSKPRNEWSQSLPTQHTQSLAFLGRGTSFFLLDMGWEGDQPACPYTSGYFFPSLFYGQGKHLDFLLSLMSPWVGSRPHVLFSHAG